MVKKKYIVSDNAMVVRGYWPNRKSVLSVDSSVSSFIG